ncbi:MAG TPA: hypothetical protein VKB50_14235 [Vicinamibacterales bacterium]|nr:hypothetical protein [Vicinamibacterales bacterium]
MARARRFWPVVLVAVCLSAMSQPRHARASGDSLTPGTRVLLDAHNAYPDQGRWADRIDRALATGLPVAIEQDLVWRRDPGTGRGRSVVSHGPPFTAQEPTLDQYFFERIRPLIERAVQDGSRDGWPLITLNLDFKDDEPEHLREIWRVIAKYDPWLCTATRRSRSEDVSPMTPGPLLILTGESDVQERVFHDDVPVGERLRLFGAVHRRPDGGPSPKTNYRRWWNNPWKVVEPEGQHDAGDWSAQDAGRLKHAVAQAHDAGLWIRFYTLDGFEAASDTNGWTASYNFGSLPAAETRWRAAIDAGVDFVAVDQYEDFARCRENGGCGGNGLTGGTEKRRSF